MGKIKVISNPYENIIEYQRWNEEEGKWKNIDNANSRLQKEELIKGFLPFIAKEIIDTIVSEYMTTDEMLEIVFEGADDEYKELASICSKSGYENVAVKRSDRYLENARDIFPDIVGIFEQIKPLISESIQEDPGVKRNLENFSDVSKDLIPICVLGNYSTGKSTFINALVGWELLANSDEPLTARVYSIIKSRFPDRARIRFNVGEDKVNIRFDEDKYRIDCDEGHEVVDTLRSRLANENQEDMLSKISSALSYLNVVKDGVISDLIEIEVPFNAGLWNTSKYQFVIFDTPGSNSTSNTKHMEVLREAMKNLTNGLPVFVSEYNTLDSKDNESLHKELRTMEGLDSRFTMIIVNKADKASLPKGGFSEDAVDRILNETLPKNLYSEGIFFVSSILGLGSKIKGEFVDDNYAEIYETEKTKYSDPESRFYKKLFAYNIMPEQIKEAATVSAGKCEDLIFANSGLYSVEEEIQKFAQKYSPYNKCQQSKKFLGEVIDRTTELLEEKKQHSEASKKSLIRNMERDKAELLDRISSISEDMQGKFIDNYPSEIEHVKVSLNKKFFQESLSDEHEALKRKQEELNELDEAQGRLKSAQSGITSNLSDNLKTLVHTRSFDAIKNAMKAVGEDFVSDTKDMFAKSKELAATKKQIDRKTAEDLIQLLNDDYYRYSLEANETLEEVSIGYWNSKINEFKDALIDIITDSTALEQSKKEEIEGIIMSFEDISFGAEEEIFVKEKFEKVFKFGKFRIGDSDNLDLERLRRDYNDKMQQVVEDSYEKIRESHDDSFIDWKTRLLNTVSSNIISYNPSLSMQNKNIQDEEKKIMELESKQRRLKQHDKAIKRMMTWKEA